MKILLRYLCVAAMLMMVHLATGENRHHLVHPGQTLYSISKMYEVTVEDILAANPSIADVSAVPTGTLLTIPEAGYAEKAGKKPDEKPVEKPAEKPVVTPTAVANGERQITVILPFHVNATSAEEKKQQMRSVEFYEGMLVAVDEWQQQGLHLTLKACDMGTEPLASILTDPKVAQSDLIVAPMEQGDVSVVAAYGDAHGIPVVSPFVFNAELVNRFGTLVQINTPKAQLYPQLCEEVVNRFADYSFVFFRDSLESSHEGLVEPLRALLNQRGIPNYDVDFGVSSASVERVDSLLGLTTDKVVYMPTASKKNSLQRLIPALKSQMDYQRSAAILVGERAVLGYPEWLLAAPEMVNDFYDMNVYLFSKLYVNPFDEEVRAFYDSFKGWYHKDLMNILPKYGLLGYDVADFFLTAMHRYGHSYLDNLPQVEKPTLQTMMRFERNGNGCYLNRGLYLVHFCPDSKIEKYEIY